MFLGQIYSELVKDFSSVAGQRSEERAVAVHDDESELVVVCQQRRQSLKREIDCFTWHNAKT